MPAFARERRAMRLSEDAGQKTLLHARTDGRSEECNTGPGANGRRGQHTDGDQKAVGSDYRREDRPQTGGTTGVHDPVGSMERDTDEKAYRGSARIEIRTRNTKELARSAWDAENTRNRGSRVRQWPYRSMT